MKTFFLTTAIDYPNSRPHIGTAFEKIGADVQARFRRMHGYDVHFLMGNDENTVKVARRAEELGRDVQDYCNDMANQFKDVWRALELSFDDFIQTSEPRHHHACQKFIQKVYDNGHIYKGSYEGWYCDGCEAFKTDTEVKEADGLCPAHRTPVIRRTEPCYFFALSKYRDQLLDFYEANPDFIQPESRRNEIVTLVKSELRDVNITRRGETWGIQVPFDPEFTIYVWFDALLNYIAAIGYGDDEARFKKWWPANVHVIGKDITRFHCALWPAMCFAAGIDPPKTVFGHGFVYIRDDKTGTLEKISKSLGNVVEPMDIVTKFSAEAFRYYFMRECPFPGDGDFSWQRFTDVYNSELANNLGNLYSRVITLVTKNYGGVFDGTVGVKPEPTAPNLDLAQFTRELVGHMEAFRYNQALQLLIQDYLTPTNQYMETHAPWKLVKTDLPAAKKVLFNAVEPLRVAAIVLKPFLPKSAEVIYRSFNFSVPWEKVRYEEIAAYPGQPEDLRVLASLENGKVKPLFPRISLA